MDVGLLQQVCLVGVDHRPLPVIPGELSQRVEVGPDRDHGELVGGSLVGQADGYGHQAILRSDQGKGGIEVDAAVAKNLPNKETHDCSDMGAARAMAERQDLVPVGLLFHAPESPSYEDFTREGVHMRPAERLAALDGVLNRFEI